MAIENAKVLNTRIILKNDDLAKWNDSKLVLEKGEIALAAVTTASNGNHDVPTYLMKVGDGTHTFAELKWVAASASDVYSWAKQNSLFIDATGEGNVVSNVEWDATLNDNKGGIKITKVSVATSTQLTEALARVTALETGKLDASTFESFKTKNTTDIATAKSEAIADAKTETTTQVNALKDGEVKANADAIAAIKKDATIVTFAGVESALSGKVDNDTYAEAEEARDSEITAINNKFGDLGNQTVAAAIAAAKTEATYDDTALAGRVTAVEGDVSTIKGDYLKSTDKTELSNAISAEEQRAKGVEGGLRTDVDVIKGDYLKAADREALQKQITANATAITTITDGIDPEKIDGLTDLIDWANTHAPEVASIKKDIEDEAARAKAEEERLVGLIGNNADAIAENAEDIKANADAITALGITDGKVSKAVDSDKLGGTAAADYLKKSEAPGYDDILTKTVAATTYKTIQQAVAEAGAADKTLKISQNANGEISVTPIDILISKAQVQGLGSMAGEDKSNYKTKQTAVTETGAADKTLKISQNANGEITATPVAIAIAANQVSGLAAIATTGSTDDLVQGSKVLVFDCGSSTEVI